MLRRIVRPIRGFFRVLRRGRRLRLPDGKPVFHKLGIELQSNCNRDCFFCPRHGDDSGKRVGPDGKKVAVAMPTEKVLDILDQAAELGFRGLVAFKHMSEPFMDPRHVEMAWEARKRGMIPYTHTNGDYLRNNEELCRKAVEVFEYIVVGLYDYETDEQLQAEKAFWNERLKGTRVKFSEVGKGIPRTAVPGDERMVAEKKAFPNAPCSRPTKRLMVHYDGEIAICCEDLKAEFGVGNAFVTPIKDLWYNQRHRQIIGDLRNGRRTKYPLCAKCAFTPKGN